MTELHPVKLEDDTYVSVGCNKKLTERTVTNFTPELNEIANITLQYKRLQDTVEKDRNKCTVAEYATKWISLHMCCDPNEYVYKSPAWNRREALSQEYMNRFNIQRPIYIYNELSDTTPIAIMPAMYLPFTSFKNEDNGIIPILRISNARTVDKDTKIVEECKNLKSVIEKKNKELEEDIVKQKVRDEVSEATYKILKVFNPMHPWVIKMDEMKVNDTKEKEAEVVDDILADTDTKVKCDKKINDELTFDFE